MEGGLARLPSSPLITFTASQRFPLALPLWIVTFDKRCYQDMIGGMGKKKGGGEEHGWGETSTRSGGRETRPGRAGSASNTAQMERKRATTVVLRERLPTLLFFDIAHSSLTASSADA
jgi:hypothetical protein